MTGVGLEPTTNGLTYLIGFRRPPFSSRGVERLDYPIAIAGVPRLVSGAGTDAPSDPCLLITQSSPFSTVTLAVAGDVVVCEALRASQQTAAFTRRGSVSSHARLPFLLVVEVRCSTD